MTSVEGGHLDSAMLFIKQSEMLLLTEAHMPVWSWEINRLYADDTSIYIYVLCSLSLYRKCKLL